MKEIVIRLEDELYEQCKNTELTEENEGFDFHIIKSVANGTPLEDIVDGIKSHKWGHNEGSKEIYNNAIDDVLTYIEEKLGE